MAFEIMIWFGAALSVIGLVGLILCIVRVVRARRAKLPDDEMRAVLAKIIPLNMGALLLSVFGLIMVGAGVILG